MENIIIKPISDLRTKLFEILKIVHETRNIFKYSTTNIRRTFVRVVCCKRIKNVNI